MGEVANPQITASAHWSHHRVGILSLYRFPCSPTHALWSQARCNDFPCNKRLCIDGITDALKTKSVFNNKMILDITDTLSLESFYLIKNFMLIKC